MSSDSPKSENSQTRFSTPAPELDDHRFQARSLPRADAMSVPIVKTTDVTSVSVERPDLLQVNEALRGIGSVSRDFENAIIDDDKSANNEVPGPAPRRGSVSPMVPRRGHHRRGRYAQDHPQRSRESSTSSVSTSPPNSVEAFANPRRRDRANTIGSKAPSDLELGLQRTLSGGTHRRRPTFSNASVINREPGEPGADTSDEDVCLPTFDDTGKTYKIDFEELEEFVALSRKAKPHCPRKSARRQSLSSHAQLPKIFHDLRKPKHLLDVPQIVPPTEKAHAKFSDFGITGDTEMKSNQVLDETVASDETAVEPERNRFSFLSSEANSTVYAPELGDLLGENETFRDLFELSPEGGVWWLDVESPTEEELDAISRAFRVHPLTNEDIKTQEAREKVELFSHYYFVCFRSFHQMDKHAENYLQPLNIYMVVFREGVLTFSYDEQPHAANTRKRMGKLQDYAELGADWICYAMIDNIVDCFAPVIRDIERTSEAIEDSVFSAREEDADNLLQQISLSRKLVLNTMRLLGGKADVIKGFSKRCNQDFEITPRGDIGLYLGDIQDHVVTMMSNLGHVEKMLSRSHGNYLAQLNVDNLRAGNHANKVLGKITLIATVLVPMNLITGLFGMNVNVPGKSAGGLGWFFGIIGVICALVIVGLIGARRFRFI